MNGPHFDGLTRDLVDGLSRRRILRAAGGASTAVTALAGALGRPPLIAGAKKKKRKKKKTCQSVCPQFANYCFDASRWFCGRECACVTGTSRTICALLFDHLPGCIACQTDAECESQTGVGSVCAVTNASPCACGGVPKVCVPACQDPIPVRCS